MRDGKQTGRLAKTNVTNLRRYEPSGTYYLFARIGGKLKKQSLQTNVLTTAKLRLADAIRKERQALERRGATASGRLSVDQAAKELLSTLAAGGGKQRTAQFYQERLAALFKHFPGLKERDCAKLSVTECRAWATRYQNTVKPATYNGTLLVFRKVLDYAVEQGVRYDNPLKEFKRLRCVPKRPMLPSTEQFLNLLKHLETIPFGPVPRAAKLIRFLAFSGMRIGEARRVEWSHVDFNRKVISIHGDPETHTKNWEIRDIPMIPEMEALLLAERQARASEPPTAMVVQVKDCNGTLATACSATGIPKLTQHDLRDLFATRCIEQGIDVPTVARWLGHKDGGALLMKTYAHLRSEHSLKMGAKVSFGTGTTQSISGTPRQSLETPTITSTAL